MFYVKIHDAGYRKIIAVCDMQLIGKNLTNGEIKLDVSERFYKGDLKNKDELINGVDVYLSDQKFSRSVLGPQLKRRFKGELKITRSLYGQNKLTSRLVYRATI